MSDEAYDEPHVCERIDGDCDTVSEANRITAEWESDLRRGRLPDRPELGR